MIKKSFTLAFLVMAIAFFGGSDGRRNPRSKVKTHPAMFEGDIDLSRDQQDAIDVINNKTSTAQGMPLRDVERNAIRRPSSLWPGGVVPYLFFENQHTETEKNIILKAMEEYHQWTCLRFVPRTNQRDYVGFIKGDGCYSYTGKLGNKQVVSLGLGCAYTGFVIHELMHAIGFFHEQSRADRDEYVLINEENIKEGQGAKFDKYSLQQISHLGACYDYCSIMHYGEKDYSKNGKATIVSRFNGRCTLRRASVKKGFSDTDIRKINTLYKCTGYPQVEGGTDGCVDKDEKCAEWAQDDMGEKCVKNEWIKKNCIKSCNIFGKTTPLTKPTPKPNCENENKNCEGWANRGYCTGTHNPYMSKKCKKACGFCNCENENKKCEGWAKKGYCTGTHNLYMSENCKKACGFC